jgi:hypothetical protein
VRRNSIILALVVLFMRCAMADVDLRTSVLELEWDTATGYDRCAATVVGRHAGTLIALTAAHCTVAGFSRVRFFDGAVVPGSAVRVISRSGSSDLAEIAVRASARAMRDTPSARTAARAPDIGDILAIVGHPVSALRGPNAGRWTTFDGRMAQVTRNPNGALQFEIYCPLCGPGNSGSGVFDGDGRLVGIVYGVTPISGMPGQPDGLYADTVPAAQHP